MTASIETPQADPNDIPNDKPYTLDMSDYVFMLSRLVAMQHAPAHDPAYQQYLWDCLCRQVDYADIEGLRAGNPHIDTLPLGAPYDALGVAFLDAKNAVTQLELATHHRNEAIQTLLRAIQHISAIDTYHAIISAPLVMPDPIDPIKKKRVV
jgi:hypothetical protein